MDPQVHYATFKSDCYFQTTIQVSPTNLSYVTPGRCYPFQDGSEPVKRQAQFWDLKNSLKIQQFLKRLQKVYYHIHSKMEKYSKQLRNPIWII